MDSDQKSVISFHHPFGGDCVCLWEGVRTPGREWSLFWWDFKQRICFFCVCVELLFSPFLWLCRGSWGSCHFQAQWRVWKSWTLLQILILVGLGSKKWISESLFFFLDWTASHLPFSPAGLEIGLWWAVSGYHLWKPRPAESSDFARETLPGSDVLFVFDNGLFAEFGCCVESFGKRRCVMKWLLSARLCCNALTETVRMVNPAAERGQRRREKPP